MTKAIKKPVGRPMTVTKNKQAKYASLLLAEKEAKKARAAFEAEIRSGVHSDAFTLETPKPEYYVPAGAWKAEVGDDWFEANKVQKNQQMVIRLK